MMVAGDCHRCLHGGRDSMIRDRAACRDVLAFC
jgi:hypothetical protein